MIEKIYTVKTTNTFKTIKIPYEVQYNSYTCRIMNDGRVIYTPYDPFKIEKDKK